jgi:peptidoglycan/LPS O-acetylase OafA/YrhL
VFNLVAGAIAGAHLPAVRARVWRHRWPVLAAAAALVLAVEAWYVLTVRSGQSATRTSDPFSPEAIALYVGTLALLWLAGAWWANRSRNGGPSRLVWTTSDNSYGVYLSHIMLTVVLAAPRSAAGSPACPGLPPRFLSSPTRNLSALSQLQARSPGPVQPGPGG